MMTDEHGALEEWRLAETDTSIKVLREIVFQCHFAQHKSHKDFPQIEPGPQATNRLNYSTT
jgi:hypothetical protein